MEPGTHALTEVVTAADAGAHAWAIGGSVTLAVAMAIAVAVALRRLEERLGHADHGSGDSIGLTPGNAVNEPPGPSLAHLFQSALARSREVLRSSLDLLFGRPLDDAATERLEEALLRADVGVATTARLIEALRVAARADAACDLRAVLREEMLGILTRRHRTLTPPPGLWVILVVGVNGSGKTTTIGKLAFRLKAQGRRVLLAAGDTFRAAAEQQLAVWAERAGADLLALEQGADPGAVAYTAVEKAKAGGHDVVIVDTAGRLQTRKPLMEQLGKVRRVIDKALPGAPHETLLVVDGTMGQNALSQARLFHEVTELTGVAVTKLDGTAKGGMVLAIASELGVPITLAGLGERIEDLRDFDAEAFVAGLTAADGRPAISDSSTGREASA